MNLNRSFYVVHSHSSSLRLACNAIMGKVPKLNFFEHSSKNKVLGTVYIKFFKALQMFYF